MVFRRTRTETVINSLNFVACLLTVMGYERSMAVISIRLDQKQQSLGLFVRISSFWNEEV